jgi:hypothetical protein
MPGGGVPQVEPAGQELARGVVTAALDVEFYPGPGRDFSDPVRDPVRVPRPGVRRHGLDSDREHQPGSRREQRGVVPPLRSAHQDGKGGETAQDVAPTYRSATPPSSRSASASSRVPLMMFTHVPLSPRPDATDAVRYLTGPSATSFRGPAPAAAASRGAGIVRLRARSRQPRHSQSGRPALPRRPPRRIAQPGGRGLQERPGDQPSGRLGLCGQDCRPGRPHPRDIN